MKRTDKTETNLGWFLFPLEFWLQYHTLNRLENQSDYSGHNTLCHTKCGALRDLVPFVQFKKLEKHPRRSVNFRSNRLKPATLLTKINTPPWVFFTFFKLYKWYQIAQSVRSNGKFVQIFNSVLGSNPHHLDSLACSEDSLLSPNISK